jgi:trypsin
MRCFLTVLLLHAVFFDNHVTVEARKRIVGGVAAASGEFPFYFWAGGGRLCGGSLIWGDFVLTAAHCGHNVFYSTVKFGSTSVFNANQVSINQRIVHPNYNDTWMANDVMLVQLKNFIPRTQVNYVTLNKDPKIPADGAPITAMGYGADGKGNDYTENLMKVDLQVVGYDTCVKTYGEKYLNNSHMICNGGPLEGGKDSCYGDSGGPIMLTGSNVQVGFVSWGRECGKKGTPAVNARVSQYMPWIEQNICLYSVQPPPYYPTKSPISRPVKPPIRKPTSAPIRKPTLAPIRKPTSAPIGKPTLAPARKQTLVPPRKPTLAPVCKPTLAPVRKPSLAPVRKPTLAPVRKPT